MNDIFMEDFLEDLTRCDGKLREPFVWHQGIQVSMRMARGSVSLLSRYDTGIGTQDTLKHSDGQGGLACCDSRGSQSVGQD